MDEVPFGTILQWEFFVGKDRAGWRLVIPGSRPDEPDNPHRVAWVHLTSQGMFNASFTAEGLPKPADPVPFHTLTEAQDYVMHTLAECAVAKELENAG